MKKNNNTDEFNLISLIKFVVVVIIAFIAFYGITLLVTNNKETKKESNNAAIQYDEILVGEILNRKNETYYVLVEDSSSETTLSQYIGSNNNTKKVFFCDLENAFNKTYKSDESNLYVDNISEIRFKNTTLLEIENGKIVNSYEENEQIENTLKANSTSEKE